MKKLRFFALFFLLLFSTALRAEEISRAVDSREFSGQRISEVEISGQRISEQVRLKFMSLKGQNFHLHSVHQALLWFHENGGDSLVDFYAMKGHGGVKLLVRIKARKQISKIVFEGNQVVSNTILLNTSELKEGTDYEVDSVRAAIQKISIFYSKQGYLASDIKYSYDPTQGELKFLLSEGEPTLVGSLRISPIDTLENKILRGHYERDIADVFGLKVGDRIQRDRVLDGVQAIKDWLRSHDFLTAKDPVIEYKVTEDGKVQLNIDIQYGPRIRYGFRGNHQFSYRELMLYVGEIKEVSSGNDYLAAVRRRILESYREIGFANAQITTLVKEDPNKGIRYVSLIVNEGKKIRISKLTIEGIFSLQPAESRKVFDSLATRLVQRDYFHEGGLNKAAELFADYLKSKGYLSAKLEFTKFDFNEDRSKVNVTLLYNEGIQTLVKEVKINGAKNFSDEEIYSVLALKIGEPFDIFAFERGLIKLKEKYQDIGNLSAAISNEGTESIVRYNKDNSEVALQLDIDEGPVYRVGDILVRGNKETHARVVTRELPFTTGDILTRPLLNEAEDNLRQLNLFSPVIVKPIDRPGDDGAKDILILVEETVPGTFEIAPGYRNDLGLRLAFGMTYQNIGGWNRSVSTKFTINRRTEKFRFMEYRASFGFREPYLANWPVVYTADLEFLKSQLSGADANVSRITNGVKRDLTKILSGLLEHSYERVEISNVDESKYPKDYNRIDYIGAMTPGLVIDSRNDQFNPSKGVYSLNRFEVASVFFGSSNKVGYYKASTNTSFYVSILDDIVLATAANIGFERSNVGGQRIPITKLYRLGGMGSVRGYSDGEINLDAEKNIFGTLASINYRTEVRLPFTSSFGTAIFYDAGNLLVDRFSLSPAKLRSAVGAGLRYATPVGPVVLDFAWRLQTDKKVGDTEVEGYLDRFKVHFAIGAF